MADINELVLGPYASGVEYERDHVSSSGDSDVANLVHDSAIKGLGCIFGAGFSEELPRLCTSDRGAIHNNIGNARLVR